jgi:hypothetical protein
MESKSYLVHIFDLILHNPDVNWSDYISLCILVIHEMSLQSSMNLLSKSTGFLKHSKGDLNLGA